MRMMYTGTKKIKESDLSREYRKESKLHKDVEGVTLGDVCGLVAENLGVCFRGLNGGVLIFTDDMSGRI